MSDRQKRAAAREENDDATAGPRMRAMRNPALRWLIYVGLIVLAFVLYWCSDLMFSSLITLSGSWILVGVIAAVGAVIWIVDERREARARRSSD